MNNIQFKQNGRFFFGWWVVVLGFLCMTFGYVSFVSLTSVFVLPVTEELGFARGEFMTYLTILSLACVVASPILGRLMSKGNLKIYMILASLCGFVGYFGFSRSSELWQFFLFSVILGLGFAGTAPMPVSLLINQWFGGKVRGTATGIAFIGSGLGGMILTPVLNMVITGYGWRSAYVILGLVFIVILIPAIIIMGVKDPKSKGFERMGETVAEAGITSDKKPGMSLGEAKGTPALWLAIVSTVLVVFASSALLANSVSYFIECGIDPGKAASYAGLVLGSLIVGKPIGGFFCDKIGIRRGAGIITIVFALTFAALYFMPLSAVLVFAVIAFYGLGGPTITIVPPLLVNGLFGEKDYGTIVGLMNTATSLGGAFGGMIAARIYDFTGSYSTFWLIAATSVFIAAILRFICFKLQDKNNTW